MKRLISGMLALVMAVSASCFTFVVHAEDTEKRLYIVRLSQPPIYEASDTTQLTLYGTSSSSTSTRAKELKIQSEHKAFKTSVSKNTDSNIVYEYNQVFNGMAIEATVAEIEAIKNMSGVTAVYESKSYTIDEPETGTSESEAVYDLGDNINADTLRDEMNSLSENSGNGEGMVIAIADSEFDVNHEAFTLTDNSNIKITKKGLSSMLTGLSIGDLTANQVYQNEKIPFVYNYVNKNKDVTDYKSTSIHGTHVSGISAGNSDTLKGIAPNAQLVLMKCATDEGVLQDAAIIAAVNDAIKLKADVINLSLGTAYASANKDEPIMEAMRNVGASPTELFAATGNDGLGKDSSNKAYTSEVEYGAGGVPAGSSDIVAVANAYSSNLYDIVNVMNVYDTNEELSDTCTYMNGADSDFTGAFKAGKYEIIDAGLGTKSDYTDIDVTGKIVIVQRGGDLNSRDKRELVEANGGIGMIFVTSEGRDTLYSSVNFPVAQVSVEGYKSLKDAKYIQATETSLKKSYPQDMNSSSSYCINEYLNSGTQISARGTDVMSSLPNDNYGAMSGTSMATPMTTGAYALVKSYLQSKYPNISSDNADFKTLCVNMMQNTADIIYNPNADDNAPYTPRAQGAGYINLDSLTKSDVVLTNKESGKGMVYYGATEDSSVAFTLCLQNLSGSAVTYNNISGVTVRDYVDDGGYIGYGSVKVDSTFDMGSSVTVPAYGSVEFPVTVSLSEETRDRLDIMFENGFFLDGFISFSGDDVQTISIPFTSFIGDYYKAPIFINDYGNLYYPTAAVYYIADSGEWKCGYSYANDRYVLSTNSEINQLVKAGFEQYIRLCMLRGTQAMTTTVRNSDGNIIYRRTDSGLYKYYLNMLSISDALADEAEGEYSVTVEGVLNADQSGSTTDSDTIDIYLDNTAPVIESVAYDDELDKIIVTASDNYDLSYAEVKDSDGTTVTADFEESDGVYTAAINAEELNDSYNVYVYDIGFNYATTEDVNAPEGDKLGLTFGDEYYEGSIFCKPIYLFNYPHDNNMSVTPILAIYDKDGRLLKTEVGNTFKGFLFAFYTFRVKLTEPTFPDLKIPEDATTKLFLWDSADDMTPVDYVITYDKG
jgi:lactocepin